MRNQIVVGLDDSPSGKAGLQWAAEQARSVGAVLQAVHALGRPYGFAAPDIPLTVEPTELTPEEPPDTRRNSSLRLTNRRCTTFVRRPRASPDNSLRLPWPPVARPE